MRRLQAVQNAAARLISGTRRLDHITPILWQLHWLFVCLHVEFKLTILVFKTLHGLAPHLGMKKSLFSTTISVYLRNDTRYGHSYCGTPIGTRVRSIEWCHFQ